jgi:hypothetical protein
VQSTTIAITSVVARSAPERQVLTRLALHREGNSSIVRKQAPRHSRLFICVAGSQKPIHAARSLPPPPGALGADSLGLDEPGDRAILVPVDPPVENCSGSCGKGGAIWGSSCLGGRLSEGPVEGVIVGKGNGPVLPIITLELLAGPLPRPDPELGGDRLGDPGIAVAAEPE